MPDDVQMSEILRQLAWASRVERRQHHQHHAVRAGPVDRGAGAADRPRRSPATTSGSRSSCTCSGREAEVKDGKVHASGRLYGIDNISFSSGDKGADHGDARARTRSSYGTTPAPASTSTADATVATTYDDDHGAVVGLGRGNQAPDIGERGADRCEAAPPEDPRRRARGRARRAARMRGPARAQAVQRQHARLRGSRRTVRDGARRAHAAKRLRGSGSGADPFAAKSLPNGDARAVAAGGPDPFTAPAASSPSSAATLTAPRSRSRS